MPISRAKGLRQACTNTGRQFAGAIKFPTLAPNISGYLLLLLLLLLLLSVIANELSLGGSSPYTSTNKNK